MRALLLHSMLLFLACLGLASEAQAFSDPHAYADGVETGGGGGRWFTGSPTEGYSCKVCHTGSAGVDVTVSGLPLAGYVSGTAYEVSLLWPETVEHIAIVAEFTDEQRHGAGQLALPRPDALHVSDLCSADQGSVPASELQEAEAGRSLVSLVDCGAKRLRFQWIAPPSAAGPVWFSAGCVFSNQDGTPAADGVSVLRRALWPQGETPERDIASGCSVLGSPTRAAGSRGTSLVTCIVSIVGIVGIVGLCVGARARRRRKGT